MNLTKTFMRYLFIVGVLILGLSSSYADSHDVAWTFGNTGFFSYDLDSFSPASSNLGTVGTSNPDLTLHIGQRYEVTITNPGIHPFEVLAKGGTAVDDVVLLSQKSGVNPPLESDPGINWVQSGGGVVTFTMTQTFYDNMVVEGNIPGYRCQTHTTTMRGDFLILSLPLDDPIPEPIPKGSTVIELTPFAVGLVAPLHLEEIDDGSGRVLVLEQNGKVFIVENGFLHAMPFLDVTELLVSPLGIIGGHDENDFDERGLLGLALHPEFTNQASPGYRKVFTYTSEPVAEAADFTTVPLPDGEVFNHQTIITEWTIDQTNPNRVDPDSRRVILRIDQPQFNHDGGMVAFGHDGYLYISLGDGGGADDTANGHGQTGNGQNINTVHGSILRIDPLDPATTGSSADAPGANGKYRVPADNVFVGVEGVDEIFAYGLRNPYRFSFDSLSGDLIVADVGQNFIEEVDIVVSGGNYGWNQKEGSFKFDPLSGNVTDDLTGLPEGLIDPVAEYDHDEGTSIIGGYLYNGSAFPELVGKYIFGDFSTGFSSPMGRLFYADLATGEINEFQIGTDDRALGLYMKGFGQDAQGELYVLASSNLGPYGDGGVVLKIDTCSPRTPADINGDCIVNLLDFADLAVQWLSCTHVDVSVCGN